MEEIFEWLDTFKNYRNYVKNDLNTQERRFEGTHTYAIFSRADDKVISLSKFIKIKTLDV